MKTRFIIAALAFAAAVPALAGTIVTAAQGKTAIASDSVKQKNTPTAKGGLLNTDATPAQAKAAARDTNARIARGQIAPRDSR